MHDTLDLDRYPLDRPGSPALLALIERCRAELAELGMFNLDGFVHREAVAETAAALAPRCAAESFTHQRRHNVYFEERVAGLSSEHPALVEFDTVNHTLCGDQLAGSTVQAIYDWPPLAAFLAEVMGKPALYSMDDPLARLNILEYRRGETLNWHFDRSQYTTTLLLQAAHAGGEFEYCSNLRSDEAPNYAGVARVLAGDRSAIRTNPLGAGTLNVFAGRNTLHRVSKVHGERHRMVAVFSYYDQPGVQFSTAERMGFYGRAG